MKKRILIYILAAVAMISANEMSSEAASLSLGSSAGIATALEAYEENRLKNILTLQQQIKIYASQK